MARTGRTLALCLMKLGSCGGPVTLCRVMARVKPAACGGRITPSPVAPSPRLRLSPRPARGRVTVPESHNVNRDSVSVAHPSPTSDGRGVSESAIRIGE
jgi:hypothetical protein